MSNNFRDFKKELERKKMQDETIRLLEGSLNSLTRKRDEYIKKAKEALKAGNSSVYEATVGMIKYATFNIHQTEDMISNFTIARDMCEMQHLNKSFIKSLDAVMKDVSKTCKSIHVSNSDKLFQKALFQQNEVSAQLQHTLASNNMSFKNSVTSLSDISDLEVKDLLEDEIKKDNVDMDDMLSKLEAEFSIPSKEQPVNVLEKIGGPSNDQISKPESHNISSPVSSTPKNMPEYSLINDPTGYDPFATEFKFDWNSLPCINFSDIAGLEDVKEEVRLKVLLPLQHPEAFEGYDTKSGGGLCLYGPPGTGKTMVAAAIANEIGAKFCSIKVSDLMVGGVGNNEKAVKALFAQARTFKCAVINFDEFDAITPKETRSQISKQLRSELLSQMQGIDSYKKDSGNILFLIAQTNKPWNIDSAFLRPGRFGTRIYVGLPDAEARRYMFDTRLEKIRKKGSVALQSIDVDYLVEKTDGFNGSDISALFDKVQELSIKRGIETGAKYISNNDFDLALEKVHSSVQTDDIYRLMSWKGENDN